MANWFIWFSTFKLSVVCGFLCLIHHWYLQWNLNAGIPHCCFQKLLSATTSSCEISHISINFLTSPYMNKRLPTYCYFYSRCWKRSRRYFLSSYWSLTQDYCFYGFIDAFVEFGNFYSCFYIPNFLLRETSNNILKIYILSFLSMLANFNCIYLILMDYLGWKNFFIPQLLFIFSIVYWENIMWYSNDK